VTDVKQAIIGADFLAHYGLVVDLKHRSLRNGKTSLQTNGILSQFGIGRITTFDSNSFADFLQEFSNITKPINFQESKHGVTHHIGPPVAESARRLAGEKLHVARTHIQHILDAGLCRPSSSPWFNLLHLVPKKNGDWRICGDYHIFWRLNKVTVHSEIYTHIPHLYDFTHNLENSTIFTTLDLIRAYH